MAVAASTPETLNAPEPSRRSARGGRGASEPLGDLAPPPTSAREGERAFRLVSAKAGVVANGGVFGVTTDEPPPPEALPEHTVRALRAPRRRCRRSPSRPNPRRSARAEAGGEKSASLKPPKCAVCASHKKGVCGTATAPLKCARRRENEKEKASSSDLRMDGAREAGTRAWDVAADGPPRRRLRS